MVVMVMVVMVTVTLQCAVKHILFFLNIRLLHLEPTWDVPLQRVFPIAE